MAMINKLRALPSLSGPFQKFCTDVAPDDPIDLFSMWLGEAIEAGIHEPHAMVLSTVDKEGVPDARVLILKNVDRSGFQFATIDNGPKGQQISGNSSVALTFYWQNPGRQVRVRGKAVRATDNECEADFLARSSGARAATLASRQSDLLTSAIEFEEAFVEQKLRMQAQPDVVAQNWALFTVIPHEIEFWQADEQRRHQRLRYRREMAQWQKERLWP